jgi:hypothetical protein
MLDHPCQLFVAQRVKQNKFSQLIRINMHLPLPWHKESKCWYRSLPTRQFAPNTTKNTTLRLSLARDFISNKRIHVFQSVTHRLHKRLQNLDRNIIAAFDHPLKDPSLKLDDVHFSRGHNRRRARGWIEKRHFTKHLSSLSDGNMDIPTQDLDLPLEQEKHRITKLALFQQDLT